MSAESPLTSKTNKTVSTLFSPTPWDKQFVNWSWKKEVYSQKWQVYVLAEMSQKHMCDNKYR